MARLRRRVVTVGEDVEQAARRARQVSSRLRLALWDDYGTQFERRHRDATTIEDPCERLSSLLALVDDLRPLVVARQGRHGGIVLPDYAGWR